MIPGNLGIIFTGDTQYPPCESDGYVTRFLRHFGQRGNKGKAKGEGEGGGEGEFKGRVKAYGNITVPMIMHRSRLLSNRLLSCSYHSSVTLTGFVEHKKRRCVLLRT